MKLKTPVEPGDWIPGLAIAPTGLRNYYLFSPPGVRPDERLPLLVMLHGCRQDAVEFARSTRMNRLAARERFFVLYPEQDRMANPHACWNWFDTSMGTAYSEIEIVKAAIDQACLRYPIDRDRVAVAGLSAGASIGALLVTRYPERFTALIMHSGIPPGAAYSPATAVDAMLGIREPAALPKRPLPPLLVIHGGQDDVVSASNALAVARVWADAAGARADVERRIRRRGRYEMISTDFIVEGRAAATLCEVAKLGHAWSGGDSRFPYTDPRGPDASGMVWEFADRHSRANHPAAGVARRNSGVREWPWNRSASGF
jgi:poly(hydroxyalkanoate) depolymerase family esterase